MHRLSRRVVPQLRLQAQAYCSQSRLPAKALYQPGKGRRKYSNSEASPGPNKEKGRKGAAYGSGNGDENEHYSRKHQPSPESSERDSFSEEFEHRIPSNKAHPTLSDEYQHSGADPQHPKRPSKEELSPEERKKQDKAEEDVKKHNEDMKKRYDRAYVQLGNHGEFRSLEEEVEEFRNRVN
ncbi:conserved hypothetical protein [Histoplasma capsulatum var. duboisii H88]|uniref:Uncharacterized protein n=1 Tax=Ajellomyces capsulatus (strain H88) TaxID=544711 RepID=F0U8Q2_AJEC8|nr:conserved hypothetical protein [Histoplasma capsulatum var. duboisii H88]QSS52608.1 hypothetical protein I7I53_08302 [Histoplasma capsulatum var. duboisii H88]